MNRMDQIEQRRKQILTQMESIRSLELGTLTEQMLAVKHKGKKDPVLRGPYAVLARWQNGKTCSRRVNKQELAQVRQEVENRKRLETLCEEFTVLTHELGTLERQQEAEADTQKKTPKSPSKKTRKSSGS